MAVTAKKRVRQAIAMAVSNAEILATEQTFNNAVKEL